MPMILSRCSIVVRMNKDLRSGVAPARVILRLVLWEIRVRHHLFDLLGMPFAMCGEEDQPLVNVDHAKGRMFEIMVLQIILCGPDVVDCRIATKLVSMPRCMGIGK